LPKLIAELSIRRSSRVSYMVSRRHARLVVKERQEWLGRVRGPDGRQRWIRAVDLRQASGSGP
jgi:hypothetical protein